MPEDFKLPLDPTQLLNYISTNAIMIAVILLVTLVALVGFVKMKNSIVPVGIAIIAAGQGVHMTIAALCVQIEVDIPLALSRSHLDDGER